MSTRAAKTKIRVDIWQHMTESEKRKLFKLYRSYGAWIALLVAVPASFALTLAIVSELQITPKLSVGMELKWHTALFIVAVTLVIWVISVVILRRRVKDLLCSTEWAQRRGYTLDDL